MKTWTRLCHKGHLVADLYHRLNGKSEFRSFSDGDSGWPSYSQNTLEVPFCSIVLKLFDHLRNLNRRFSDILWPVLSTTRVKIFFFIFEDLRLADKVIAARRSDRKIESIPVVFGALYKFKSTIVLGHFVAKLYNHLDEKSWSEITRFFGDCTFSC